MFERFTDRARRVVVMAQEEAKTLQHNEIGPEHILLGVLSVDGGVAQEVLKEKFNLTHSEVRAKVQSQQPSSGRQISGHIPFTPPAKKVLELALRAALQLGHKHIGTEHILLGLIAQGTKGGGLAFTILRNANPPLATEEKIRTEVAGRLRGQQEADAPKATTAPATTKSSKVLDQFGTNMTDAAAAGELDPVIGRGKEIDRALQILGRRTKNNPILLGEPGVGKTAIVEGIAQRIVARETPPMFFGKQVYTLDLSSMVAGSRYRGDFEERVKKVLDEIITRGDIILFIDEMHTLLGAGSAEGAIDASSMLKPLLARGKLQTIGATTLNEYRKYLEKDTALARRFQSIQVEPPSVADSIQILMGLRSYYEAHHGVTYTDSAIVAAVELSDRYIPERYLPDKAIDLIDEVGSRRKIFRTDDDTDESIIDDDEIADILHQWTGVPVNRMTEDEATRLLRMEDELHRRIIGQHDAITVVSKAIRRTRSGLKDPKRPSGAFIFAGPSGVGKTETAKALTEFLFGTDDALIQLDMSEYMEKHTVSRLLGAPPGYVGYDEGGQLTEAVRRKPFSVVLFDEIEKAHPDVFNVLLQLLEEGQLTDAQGRTVDFKNTVIIMTTNLGTRNLGKPKIGFGQGGVAASEYEEMSEKVSEDLKQHFKPEFINRLDEIVVFHKLSREEIHEIVDLLMVRVRTQLEGKGIDLSLTEGLKDYLAEVGYDPNLGARPLRRTIQNVVEDALAGELLAGNVSPGAMLLADYREAEGIVFERVGETDPIGELIDQLEERLREEFGLDFHLYGSVDAKKLIAYLARRSPKSEAEYVEEQIGTKVRTWLSRGTGRTVGKGELPIEEGDTISIQLWDNEAELLMPSITLEEIIQRDIHAVLRLEKTNPERMEEGLQELTNGD